MASSNIKLFDENKGNMLSDSEFSISTQRLNGLQTGVASSQLQNKAMYQASLVAYAIAQVMMQNGKNANDTDAVSAFVANLSGTMLQKVYDLATTDEAKAGVATGKWMSPALVKAAIDTLAAKAQNVLSDTTKTLYGLGSSAVPNDVFAKIAQQLSEKAPAGYGLGSSSGAIVPENDCNKAIKAGFYSITPSDANSPGWWASMLVVPRGPSEVAQIAFRINGAEIAERYSTNGVFSSWKNLTFQNKLTKIPLPSAGSMTANTTYAYYTKDQFGMVSVMISGNVTTDMTAGADTQISLLPEGFRPSNQCTSVGWTQGSGQNFAPGAIWMKETGVINFRPSITISKDTYIFGQINFIAG